MVMNISTPTRRDRGREKAGQRGEEEAAAVQSVNAWRPAGHSLNEEPAQDDHGDDGDGRQDTRPRHGTHARTSSRRE
jgi:hypothetical protein